MPYDRAMLEELFLHLYLFFAKAYTSCSVDCLR